jgi:hypothetical protein
MHNSIILCFFPLVILWEYNLCDTIPYKSLTFYFALLLQLMLGRCFLYVCLKCRVELTPH